MVQPYSLVRSPPLPFDWADEEEPWLLIDILRWALLLLPCWPEDDDDEAVGRVLGVRPEALCPCAEAETADSGRYIVGK